MKISTRKIVVAGMLGGITVILGMTPLGMIPLGVISITTLHIPVIIGTLIEGPVVGVMLGGFFGIFSFIRMSMGSATAFSLALLYNPIILVLPRVLIALGAYGVYKPLRHFLHGRVPEKLCNTASWAVAAVVGTFVNTVGVLSLADIINGNSAAESLDMSREAVRAALYGIAATNGIPECIAAAVIVVAVMAAMSQVRVRFH